VVRAQQLASVAQSAVLESKGHRFNRAIALTSQFKSLECPPDAPITISVRVQQPHTAQKLTILIQNYYKVIQNLLCLQKLYLCMVC
jgi:gluconate kinase